MQQFKGEVGEMREACAKVRDEIIPDVSRWNVVKLDQIRPGDPELAHVAAVGSIQGALSEPIRSARKPKSLESRGWGDVRSKAVVASCSGLRPRSIRA
jgi:hypothetical protein